MNTTLIDQAMSAFVAAITPTTGVTGVYEDRSQVYTHEDAPAISVSMTDATAEVQGDQSPSRSVVRVVLQVDLAVYTRSAIDATGQEVPCRQLAGPVWAAAHQLLMQDPSLGGKALRVRWRRSNWRTDAADGAAGWATHTYELTLAMRELDLQPPH